MQRRLQYVCVGALLLGIATAVGIAYALARRPVPTLPVAFQPEDDGSFEEPARERPGYVGPQACAECHAQRVQDFLASHHYRACRPAEVGQMPASFSTGKGSFQAREPWLRFEMTQTGKEFFQTAIRQTGQGEQRGVAKIAFVYGAGGADEVYLAWHDDLLYELPIAWLHPQQKWGANPYDRHGEGDFGREMTVRCLECHNTWFNHAPGTRNQYQRDDIILGVTCERCHGPGQEHVRFHQANTKAEAKAIVHPGRLARARQIEVCGQCHSNATKPRGPAFRYRPGQPLDQFYRTNTSKYPEDDHVANQVKYLKLSKCFQKDDTLTCTTCHNPHGGGHADHASMGKRMCSKCHQPADCGAQGRLPLAVRNDCVGCHMPQHIKINVFFHTEDDRYVPPIRRHEHKIGIYLRATQEVLLQWHRTQVEETNQKTAARLAQEVAASWLAEADQCRQQYRFLAAIGALREALRVDPTPAVREKLAKAMEVQTQLDDDWAEAEYLVNVRQFKEARAKLERVLVVKPDLAKAHGKLGTVLAILGEPEEAVQHLQAVAKYDPDDPYGYAMLGWLTYLQGKAPEAVQFYRKADEIEPHVAKTKYHLGLALAKGERWSEASEAFRQAITIDPKYAGACQGLAVALGHLGQADEGLRYAKRAAHLTSFEDPEILATLAEAYLGAGRSEEAVATASQALQVAQAKQAALVPQIRWQVEQIRSRAGARTKAK